jgi:hypothetical protein
MWKGWDERENRENAMLDFWDACVAQDARRRVVKLDTTRGVRGSPPTMEERRVAPTNA